MNNENVEGLDSLNQEGSSDEVISEDKPVEESETSKTDEGAEEIRKQTELAKNYKKRAEKAEKDLKSTKDSMKEFEEVASREESHSNSPEQLTPKDYLALRDSDISAEDFDEVQSYANFRNVPIAQILKDKTLKAILEDRTEERRTADATQVKGGQRGASKTTGADLLAKAEKTGEVPDTAEGMKAMQEARIARLRQERNK